MDSQNREDTAQTALYEAREQYRRSQSAEALGLDLNRLRFARYLIAIGRLDDGISTTRGTSAASSNNYLAPAA